MRLGLKTIAAAGIVYGLLQGVVADCECGYNVNLIHDEKEVVFTDLLESDFTKLKDISVDTDWVVQEWQVDAKASNGPYGRKTQRRNVVSNPIDGDSEKTVNGDPAEDAGLNLFVRPVEDDLVPVSEVDTARTDILYGSMRASIKATGVNGTCGAFFWYLNDTQEIDMEFLSSQFTDDTSPLNLVMHSELSQKYGGDASQTPSYTVVKLPLRADEAFHEYRFDWTPGKVSFYVDGRFVDEMVDAKYVPSNPGKIIVSHWSNGNPLWSGGPPEEDAIMSVQYVKAYFNSTDPRRISAHRDRCRDRSAPNAVCDVPDQTRPPLVLAAEGDPAKPYFFSQDQSNNKTVNQTVYGEIESGRKSFASSLRHSTVALIAGICAAIAFVV